MIWVIRYKVWIVCCVKEAKKHHFEINRYTFSLIWHNGITFEGLKSIRNEISKVFDFWILEDNEGNLWEFRTATFIYLSICTSIYNTLSKRTRSHSFPYSSTHYNSSINTSSFLIADLSIHRYGNNHTHYNPIIPFFVQITSF